MSRGASVRTSSSLPISGARPKRTFLEVDEFHALLAAAGELESEARDAQVDLARGRLKLADSKTEAGVREVEITLYLRDHPSYVGRFPRLVPGRTRRA